MSFKGSTKLSYNSFSYFVSYTGFIFIKFYSSPFSILSIFVSDKL